MIKKTIHFFILMIFFPASSYSFDLYIHSVKAPLYQSPSIGSQKVTDVQKGEKLIGIQEKRGWYEVIYKNKKGWIYKLMARKIPPFDKKGLHEKDIEELSYKARRRSSAFTTTAAARGLKAKRKRFADKYQLDCDALIKMESIQISDEEANDFLMRGVSNE
ncbi:MAG: SH3 domain-containing protein [Thermodesulfobacteriota bacterium]|nr:SH3 domain-containing protein [Thermodesulfobacteriota bacterium]